MGVLAIVPARIGSKGIAQKNFRPLADLAPVYRAVHCAQAAGLDPIVISTDAPEELFVYHRQATVLPAYAPLHTDDCPMIDVVKDVLARVPDGDPVVLLQPSQPLREAKHVRAALELLEPWVDSVVSVVALPLTHHPRRQCVIEYWGGLVPYPWPHGWLKTRNRQDPDLGATYVRDGTCYLFSRQTVERYGDIYGNTVKPLIIPPNETCPLDTEADWAEAERRLTAIPCRTSW